MAYSVTGKGYRITYGSNVIYDSRDQSRALISAKLDLDAKSPSKLTFSMPPTHPMARAVQLHDFANVIRVIYRNNDDALNGYATRIETDIDGIVTVTVVDGLAMLDMPLTCLADHGYDASQYKLTDLLAAIAECYNSMMPAEARIYGIAKGWTKYGDIGYTATIDGASTNNVVACDPKKVMSPWQMLKEWVIDPYDACAIYAYDGTTTPHYSVLLAVKAYKDDTEDVERGINLTGIRKSISSDSLVTGLYVTGGKIFKPLSDTQPATTGLYLASTARRGDTSIKIKSQVNLDYTISDGDKIAFDGNVYEAYLPLSKELNVLWTTGQAPTYTLPLTRPVQREARVTSGTRVTVSAYARDAKFAEATADLSGYDGTSYTYDGITTKVDNKVLYSEGTANRYGLKVREWSDSDYFLPSYLRDMAVVALKGMLNVEESYDADVADNYRFTGWMTHVRDEVLGVEVDMPVAKASIDLLDPSRSSYELGAAKQTLVARLASLDQNVKNVGYSNRKD